MNFVQNSKMTAKAQEEEGMFTFSSQPACKTHSKGYCMGNKATITRQRILEAAYAMVKDVGPANISIRRVAATCGVSVGSIYNYFPTKADLVAETIWLFWHESLHREMFIVGSDEDFVTFCERLMGDLKHTLEAFRRDWLSQLASLDAESRTEVRRREEAAFDHIRRGLAMAIDRDDKMNAEALRAIAGDAAAENLAALVWNTMISSLQHDDASCSALFALMRKALY